MTQGLSDSRLRVVECAQNTTSELARTVATEAYDVYTREEDFDNFPTFKDWGDNLIAVTESVCRWEISVVVDRLLVIGAVCQIAPDIHYGKVVSILWTYKVPPTVARIYKSELMRVIRELAQLVGARAIVKTSRMGRGLFKLRYMEV